MAEDSLLTVDSSRPEAQQACLFILGDCVLGILCDAICHAPVGCRCKPGWRSCHGSSERREPGALPETVGYRMQRRLTRSFDAALRMSLRAK